MTLSRILLWRHGQTEHNASGHWQGHLDSPLTERGREQARAAVPALLAYEPQQVVASDLRRATDTAKILVEASGLPLRLDKRLRETDIGHWQGLTREEVAGRFPEEFAEWLAGRDVTRRGGESRAEVADRACELVGELPPVELTVLVSHGATVMCLSAALLGLPQTPSVLGPLANCHWTELRDSGSGWTLRAHNAGAPGPVIPLLAPESDYSDAEA